jgi:hypothetical protein
MAKKAKWLGEPEEKDYAAARSYLSLLLAPDELNDAVALLRKAPEGVWRAKDILRAAKLPLLKRKQSSEVAEKLEHIGNGTPISPILLIHDGRERLEIADGYHRACAACLVDEDSQVPGRLALFGALASYETRDPTALLLRATPARRATPPRRVPGGASEGPRGD